MLRKIRLTLGILSLTLVTLLFLDFTGTVHAWFGWLARIQFMPAVLALNTGVILFLVVLTLLLGRVYCSVVCPLGVFQDVVSWLSSRRRGRKNRFRYSPAKTWLRVGVLVLFVAALLAGVGSVVALLAPYSAYGRIASNLLAPLWGWGNNVLAYLAERMDSYAFYSVDVWGKSLPTLLVAVVTLVGVVVLAWRHGRTYCNTICPVGTVLGLLSRYSLWRPTIDASKCTGCTLCARRCKASCIDAKAHRIDYSRCVACMDCIDNCREGAIRYVCRLGQGGKAVAANGKTKAVTENPVTATENPVSRPVETVSRPENAVGATGKMATAHVPAGRAGRRSVEGAQIDTARRSFLLATAAAAGAAALHAQEKKVDGGLAVIEDKKPPRRHTPLTPPGSVGARHFFQHCTACQLCVSVCPNGVLRPSTDLARLMQPVMSYERGYCRPECTKCGDVCPTGAIQPLTVADKSAVQVGHAVWIKKNCVPLTDGVECGNCARHCPTGAIQMVPSDAGNPDSLKIPVVNEERCIGCGACENLCPARPFSAIYVEGHELHRTI